MNKLEVSLPAMLPETSTVSGSLPGAETTVSLKGTVSTPSLSPLSYYGPPDPCSILEFHRSRWCQGHG
ncbi:MAG: hypothetical protein AAF546_13545 [Verrucomicrobiota bacterium]